MKNITIIKAKYIVESDRRKGKAVFDLDTGEAFTSAKECADVRGFCYVYFTQILIKGKVAKDGHLYCYVENMAYYANAIQSRLCARLQEEYDAAVLQVASYQQEAKEISRKKTIAEAKVEKLKMMLK